MNQKFRFYAFFLLFSSVFFQAAHTQNTDHLTFKKEETTQKHEAKVDLLLKEGLFSWIGDRYELKQEYVTLSRMVAAPLLYVFCSDTIAAYVASNLVVGGVNGFIVSSGMALAGIPFNYGIAKIPNTDSYTSIFLRFFAKTSKFLGQSATGILLNHYCTFK